MNRKIVTTSNKCSVQVTREIASVSCESNPILEYGYSRRSVVANLETDLKLEQGDLVDIKVVAVKPKIGRGIINEAITRLGKEYSFLAVVDETTESGYELIITGAILYDCNY